MFDTIGFSDKVAELHRLAAEVAELIAPDLCGSLAAYALTEVAAAARQVELATVALVERIDRSGAWQSDGSRSTAGYLRNALGQTDSWAKRQVYVGRRLADAMPTVRQAWLRGELGLAQATIVARALDNLDEDLASEIELVRQQAAPEESAEKSRKAYENQYVALCKLMDGQYDLRGRLDAEAGSIVRAALESLIRKSPVATGPDGTPIEPLSAGFRRAEALVEMARQAVGHSEHCPGNTKGGSRATVVVTADAATLESGYGAGEVDGHSVVSAQAVRRLACDGEVFLKKVGASGELLDFGRRTRAISLALRTYLAARDGGCVFPGCDAPPAHCEAHHLKHWVNGGGTERANLASLCRYHHHLVHDDGWRITGDAEVEVAFFANDSAVPRPGQRQGILARAPDLLAG